LSSDLLSLLCNIALGYAIRKAQENQKGLILNGTDQLLIYADKANLLGRINAIKKNTKALLDASLGVNERNNLFVAVSSPE
jgi:hypothetical protein